MPWPHDNSLGKKQPVSSDGLGKALNEAFAKLAFPPVSVNAWEYFPPKKPNSFLKVEELQMETTVKGKKVEVRLNYLASVTEDELEHIVMQTARSLINEIKKVK